MSKCFHTKFITTSPIAQMPDSDFIRFNAKTAGENAKQIVRMAVENFVNRKQDLVHIPQMKQKATVGYSVEAIIHALDGVAAGQGEALGHYQTFAGLHYLRCIERRSSYGRL